MNEGLKAIWDKWYTCTQGQTHHMHTGTNTSRAPAHPGLLLQRHPLPGELHAAVRLRPDALRHGEQRGGGVVLPHRPEPAPRQGRGLGCHPRLVVPAAVWVPLLLLPERTPAGAAEAHCRWTAGGLQVDCRRQYNVGQKPYNTTFRSSAKPKLGAKCHRGPLRVP